MERTNLVLLVEDDADDVQLTREGFRRSRDSVDLYHVPDGRMCLRYLRKENEFAEARTPDLVLLDLNMPVMDGRDVLAELREDPCLDQLAVVVLTTSRAETDLRICYQLGCRSYIVKPMDVFEFQSVVDRLCTYWFDTVTLPSG
ncbi:response regulator [Roseiconus nitratireducens]|uniref:Response regulator n=1 Tax=Roseiconus nitratireducens TaxID=2605748 RepID=A0A5M6CZF3_9BACT|nr:response regulator [Roseiconus nitratireducens]KAA5540246.1 response regulator [Roseiconus nitratireducens]